MPATPEEMKALVDAFEDAHPPNARVLADVLQRAKGVFEEHRMLRSGLAEDFETLVFALATEHGISEQRLNNAVAALQRVRIIVEQLDQLP